MGQIRILRHEKDTSSGNKCESVLGTEHRPICPAVVVRACAIDNEGNDEWP